MNIGNILNRRLGLITVPNLQKVITNLLATIGFVDGAIPDSRPYKVYTALLTQTGTDAPVATVLENTLGGVPVWSRNNIGDYSCTLLSGFIIAKATAFIGQNISSLGLYKIAVHEDSVDIQCFDTSEVEQDDLLKYSMFEIRVYN